MYARIRKWTKISMTRYLSMAEVSTALRPFYFFVHPDLFGKYPEQRAVNENSIKQLSVLLEAQQARRRIQNTPLTFYIREKTANQGHFKLVKINLSGNNVRESVFEILNSCNISTEYIDKIPRSSNPNQESTFRQTRESTNKYNTDIHKAEDEFTKAAFMRRKMKETKAVESLIKWVSENSGLAKEKYQMTEATRDQVIALKEQLCGLYNILDVKWESGWNISHIRGCLQSFVSLSAHHPHHMVSLKGRTLALGQFSGVSLDGDIFINIVDVRSNWLDLIKNVKKQDASLMAIPAYEQTLAGVLRGIHVSRRKFMPKVSAIEYCSHLRRITTSLGDFYGSGNDFPISVPDALTLYEIVIEPEAGPLMLSPTGQFITPSSCPAGQLVSFIAAHLDKALIRLTEYNIDKHVEKSLHDEVQHRFGLLALHKDDSITPPLMISCLQRLLTTIGTENLKGNILYITNYYSVLSDGVMCIPWNFK